MPRITFYPLEDADSYLFELDDGQMLLFDYAHVRKDGDTNDRRIDLATSLRDTLNATKRNYFDVVAFTHADDDHIHGMSEFFYLEHAKKYQSKERIHIRTLWVPATVIIEEVLPLEAKILQQEARYRLRQGTGIRIFSRPQRLKNWLDQVGLTLADRMGCITDAGQLVPEYTLANQGVEFFAHSPFAIRANEALIDRNDCSLVLHVTFMVGIQTTRVLLSADVAWEVLQDLVLVTKRHKNEARLAWDVCKVPHHSSYLSLNTEPGKDQTVPVPEVDWLFEQGTAGCILVSTSRPIPSNDNDPQPPHRQAANYYKDIAHVRDGEFKVTMEHPTVTRPEPLVIIIDESGAKVEKTTTTRGIAVTSRSAPRAG